MYFIMFEIFLIIFIVQIHSIKKIYITLRKKYVTLQKKIT